MTNGLLYPRLPPAVAEARLNELRRQPVSELAVEARTSDRDAVFAALGGAEADEQHLRDLRDVLVEVAVRAGYPDARGTRASRDRFDMDCAGILRERLQIVPAEAAAVDVWAFLGVMLLPDLCFWRFPDPPNDRVIGPDLTRHTFARLWWRAHQLADLGSGDPLGALEQIPENVMNQIFERRTIGGNRTLIRAVARVLIDTETSWDEIDRRPLVRDSVRRLRRVLAFTSLETLDDSTIEELIRELFEQTASALRETTAEPVHTDSDADAEFGVGDHQGNGFVSASEAPQTAEQHGGAAADFDQIPLAKIPAQIATLVTELGGVSDADLCETYMRRFNTTLTDDDGRLLRRFAWSAKGRGFVDLDEDNELWLPGAKSPVPIEQLGDWSIRRIYDRAADLLRGDDEDPFAQLVGEVYRGDGRVPRLIMSIVGTTLNRAKRDLRARR